MLLSIIIHSSLAKHTSYWHISNPGIEFSCDYQMICLVNLIYNLLKLMIKRPCFFLPTFHWSMDPCDCHMSPIYLESYCYYPFTYKIVLNNSSCSFMIHNNR